MHPTEVVYLEHDGKLLLVDDSGIGPQPCIMGRQESSPQLRFPTKQELDGMDIPWEEERITDIRFNEVSTRVIHGLPLIEWPSHWTWKDEVISDNAVHPIAREAVYRSIHRLVSKVIIQNEHKEVLYDRPEAVAAALSLLPPLRPLERQFARSRSGERSVRQKREPAAGRPLQFLAWMGR